ncbi:hypothetical protein ACFORN_14955 [Clostridium disporicum]
MLSYLQISNTMIPGRKRLIEKVIYIYIRRYNIKKDKGKRREKNSYESIIHKESEENKDNIIVFINEDKVVSIF